MKDLAIGIEITPFLWGFHHDTGKAQVGETLWVWFSLFRFGPLLVTFKGTFKDEN